MTGEMTVVRTPSTVSMMVVRTPSRVSVVAGRVAGVEEHQRGSKRLRNLKDEPVKLIVEVSAGRVAGEIERKREL